jgi:hypothetical protein
MAWRGLTSNNGKRSASISPHQKLVRGVGARALMIVAVWKASSGSSGLERRGASCPGDMAARVRLAPAHAVGRGRGTLQALAGLLSPAA